MLIEPRDSLIVRDGRPFTNSPGARARSLPFPLPQTLAGAYRSRRGLQEGLRFPEEAERVLSWGVKGPLLAEEGEGGWRLLAPRPLDAVRLGETVYPLAPLEPPEGAGTNLPQDLLPVALEDPSLKEKPGRLPSWWYWENFQNWLLNPHTGFRVEGQDGPVPEVRTHVSLDPSTGTGLEGALFQTQGLEFRVKRKRDKESGFGGRLALVLWPEDGVSVEGIHPLGGERRLAYWHSGGPQIPLVPERLVEALLQNRAARLVLLTPAFFHGAYLPEEGRFLGATAVAAAVGRPLVVSGWDLKAGRPKPTRRAVPAGSVYFLRLPQAWGEAEVREWIAGIWFQNLSDREQDRKDGYGLAALGVWSGRPLKWR
ncbi:MULTISPECIES: type III-B CRISPR module-associated protein Cmr3 [Thermus]|jgi:CRISPR-associated protein Cmr3|uniref:type III-B CRISPR module-associated protein Cmr3 n=1 Tax=Thermus TaxID=270 RepID=UPI0005437573|nr:type III-B CRISPR module-associated protein Cmr3 [Thermus sp. 2.9]KHG65652.1 CRISPR-associated protein Cmr3 [Thermus sp. 2.9]NHK39877.1 CRISPR-associated protein Cmr3 [Thermus thermophilus]